MSTLNSLGLKHKTDKASDGHAYLDFYERHLPGRDAHIKLLELGIGGYEFPDRGGESLRMWREYFYNAQIVGVDVYAKDAALAPGCVILQGSQTNEGYLNSVIEKFGQPHVIIDDASHINAFSIITFNILFGQLLPGGTYIWEDVHTSLWTENYGGEPQPMVEGTALHFLARLMCGLQVDTIEEQYRMQWDGHIESMHFMRNTCVIRKRS